MIASNENNSIIISRTPCGRMIFMKIGGVGLWLNDGDFASLATVVRQALDNMMDAFLSGMNGAGRGECHENELNGLGNECVE